MVEPLARDRAHPVADRDDQPGVGHGGRPSAAPRGDGFLPLGLGGHGGAAQLARAATDRAPIVEQEPDGDGVGDEVVEEDQVEAVDGGAYDVLA